MPTTLTTAGPNGGEFSIHYDGSSYVRSTTTPLHVIEKTGDDDRIVNFTFTIPSTLSGDIASATLNFEILSVVAGTGAEELRIGPGSASANPDDEEQFTGIHIVDLAPWATAIADSVGVKSVALNSAAIAQLQASVNELANTTKGISLSFEPGSSAHEEITIAAGATIDLVFGTAEDRYWVGGTDTWDTAPGLKWAITSNGAGGASVPTLLNNVFFDANSGIATDVITISNAAGSPEASCKNFDTTGFPGTFNIGAGADMEVVGDFLIGAATTFDFDGRLIVFGDVEYHASCTITGLGRIDFMAGPGLDQYFYNNGKNVDSEFNSFGGGNIHITGDITSTHALRGIHCFRGFYYGHNYNVSLGIISFDSDDVRGLFMGTGTWEHTAASGSVGFTMGTIFSAIGAEHLTVEAGTSLVKLTHTSANYTKNFIGANKKWYNLIFSGDASGTGAGGDGIDFAIQDSNGFSNIACDSTGTTGIAFEAGTTQTVNSITLSGSVGNNLVLKSTSAGTAWSIRRYNGGNLSCDYVTISDCDPTPGTLLYCGTHSTDAGGNSERVIFGEDAPPDVTTEFPIKIGASKKNGIASGMCRELVCGV